jgi:hypothetical protein
MFTPKSYGEKGRSQMTDENGMNTTMLMTPANGVPFMGGYGNNGLFGGGDSWLGILFLIALCNGGFGFGGGFGGGYGNMMLGYDFPWLLNGQNGINANVNGGFRDAQLHDSITSTRDAISALATQLCQCCGDMQLNVSNGINSVNNSIFGAQAAISQQMNANEIASLNRSYAEQTANQQNFNGVMSGIADLRYTEATEGCATRTAAAQNTRDIVDAIRGGDQMIMDKLCALELDGVKNQLAQAQRDNIGLQNAVNMATMQANSLATADNIVDNLYNRLKNCPVNTTPVYGNQPIFTCPQNLNSGCGCGSF